MTSIYEYPLHERIRLFMRLEQIFSQMDKFSLVSDYYNAQLFLNALFDVIELFQHYDIRAEIIKELLSYKNLFQKNYTQLDKYCDCINLALQDIHAFNFNTLNNQLRENHFLVNLRRQNFNLKSYLFDMPTLQYWIQKSIKKNFFHNTNLLFQNITNAVFLIMNLIRSTVEEFQESTTSGSFIKDLDRKKCNQMVRVFLAEDADLYSVINGDRNRIMIRFYRHESPENKPIYVDKETINFRYHLCTV